MDIAQQLRGTGVALVTPFDSNHKIDEVAYRKLIQYTIQGGVDYLVVNGTTAESSTTTFEEKQFLLNIAKEEAKKASKGIMLGVGGNNTQEVIDTILKFNLEGVHSILSVCPYYNKPSQEGVFQHYKAIAEKSPLPIVLYNVPARTGINMQASTIARLAAVPNIVGIKEALGDINLTLDIKRLCPKEFLLISGDDMVASSMIALGGIGSISVLANAFPKLFSDMINHALNGKFEESAKELIKLSGINPDMYTEGNPVGIKTALKHLGLCSANFRLPLVPASSSLDEKIKTQTLALIK